MSIWSDIQKRSAGILKREKDEKRYIKLDKIIEMLRSMKVGVNAGEYPPFVAFYIRVEHFDNSIGEYSIFAQATQHEDGRRDFYSETLLNSIKEIMDKRGYIIQINDLFL